MNWNRLWIDQVLAEIPAGSCRRRMEAELRDHLETLYGALADAGRTQEEARAEALLAMGKPEKLREEYRAVWRRSLPGRLELLGGCLRAWARGCAVMFGVHLLTSYVLGLVWQMALSLPGDSRDPWVQMIRGTVGNLNNTWLRYVLPLVLALTAGASLLGRRFQTSRRPAGLISVGLSFHWAAVNAFHIWWEAMDDHRAFGAELMVYLTNGPSLRYYFLTLMLCILLGLVFAYLSGEREHFLPA